MSNRLTGTVKFYDNEKKWGFINEVEGYTKDIFVHEKDLGDTVLNKGDKVSFEPEDTKKGTKAVRITVEEAATA